MKDNNFSYLKWLPWVGGNLQDKIVKLLIIGESHYAQSNGSFDEATYNEFQSDRASTINIIKRQISGEKWSLFTNLYFALFKKSNIDVESFWSDVAFYNYIQRPMKTIQERPTDEDFKKSFSSCINLIKDINATHCIFLGTSSIYKFDEELAKTEDVMVIDKNAEKVGRFWAFCRILEINNIPVKVFFIRHPSTFFSWKKWHDYLKNKDQSLLKGVKS